MELSEFLAILMLKVKQRSCGGRVIHWKPYCMVKLFLLATAVLIPELRFLPFFWLSPLFFYFTYNASIYSSFVHNYLPSRKLAVFALCHSLGGALAKFGATRGFGICQPQGAEHRKYKKVFFLQILLKKYIEQYVLRIHTLQKKSSRLN